MAEGDDDRTILRPTPGGRRAGAVAPAANGAAGQSQVQTPHADAPAHRAPAAGAEPGTHEHPDARPGAGRAAGAPEIRDDSRNPLIAAGATLLTLAAQLRNTPHHDDVAGLRERALAQIRAFDERAREADVDADTANLARYALCALLDETVLNTPWGSESVWATSSLLITLYRERTGGERIFQLIDQLGRRPAENLDSLEFLFVCLCLGFQGRYAVRPNGQAELQEVREGLRQTLKRHRPAPADTISPHWEGLRDNRPRVARTVPLWVAGAAAGALVTVLFVVLTITLNRESDRAFARLDDLLREPVPTAAADGEGQAAADLVAPETGTRGVSEVVADLRETLAPEIRDGKVEVLRAGGQARIRLRNRGLFPSGSASVSAAYEPVLAKIARAIADAPGPIMVTGHSDNVPIRTAAFPSNWHLSNARAEAVMGALKAGPGAADRFVAEGRSDSVPIADNATAAGRAKNRRVEINLRPW